MRIRTKTLAMVTIISIAVFSVTYMIGSYLLMPSFLALERQETEEKVFQVINIISNDVTDLDGKASDWGHWDDTYQFAQGTNEEYVDLNLGDETFHSLQLNFIIIINSEGQLLYSKSVDYAGDSVLPDLESVNAQIMANPNLWNFSHTDEKIEGLLILADDPSLFVSKPILTSLSEGPIAGTLIMGRYLSTVESTLISETMGLPITIMNIAEVDHNEYTNLEAETNGMHIFTKPLSEKTVAGYAVLQDINNDPAALLQVNVSRDIYAQGLVTINYYIAASHSIWLIFAMVTIVIMEKGIVRPIQKLTTSIKQMTTANSNIEPARIGGDETKMLTEAIKDTLTQRMAAIEELAGMVGHDLRNPLQGISGATYYLKTKCSANMNETGKEMLKIIEEDITYSNKIINDLLDYSRQIHLELTTTNPKSLIEKSLRTIKIPDNIKIKNETEDTSKIDLDETKIQRAFLNIINNAIDAMPKGGTLTISSRKTKSEISFIFEDTGMGIPKQFKEKIWTPLFTTKAKGMGFGLAICKRLIEAHYGSITIDSIEGKGTRIEIKLPLDLKRREKSSDY